ncbi:MAG: TonB-dependent receptor [Methyloglobulus sp.]|nr:TonB-dependent receptor [Methyloglobulus sp.]
MHYEIAPQSLDQALVEFSNASGLQVMADGVLTSGVKSSRVTGNYSSSQALGQLLAGTGLEVQSTQNGTVTLQLTGRLIPTAATQNEGETLPKVTVEADADNPYDDPNWATDPYNKDYNRPNATTATKTDTPIMETPVSIQVVPRGVLADKQTTNLPDAVNGHVSGVLGRTGGGYLYDNFIIRGMAGSGFGDAYRNGLFNRQDIYDIANIEQIDILKGPAAVLYGRIEPGGLVNYVTKKPLATPYYSLQQQFGSYDQYRTQFDATGPIDKDKTLLYRVNGSYSDNQSFRDFVGNERFFVAPAVTWRPNEKFVANFELEYKHDRLNADYGIPAIGDRPAPIPITRTLKDGSDRQLLENTLVGFDWTYRFNEDWKITQRYLFKDWTLSGPTLFNFGGLQQVNNRFLLGRTASKGVQDVQTHSTNLDLNGKFEFFGSKHNLLIGVDGFYATTEAHDADAPAPDIDIFNPVYGQVDFNALTQENSFFYRKENWFGAYIQDQITLFDKLHIMLGGRYDNVTTGGNFTTASLDAAKAGREAKKDDAFSPRAGILYQVRDWLSVYGSYTESFSGNNNFGKTTFDPQEGKQYELGLKAQTPDQRFSSTLAFFHLTKTNLLTDDPERADPNFQILAGKNRSKGIEFDLAGQVTDNLNLLATYAYTQSTYTQDFSGFKGNRLENVPRHQGSLWGTWQFNDAFKVGLGVVAVGKRYGDAGNTYSLPGYVRMDAMAAYTYRIGQHRLTAQVNLNNLLDKEYFANSDGGSLDSIPGTPINVFGSLKYEF